MTTWRKSSNYRRWRKRVIKRDVKCIICGEMEHLHAHHLNHATFFINQRFSTKNGITLCSKCHMNFHCNFKRSYRTKCDESDFRNWLVMIYYILDKKEMISSVLQIKRKTK